MNNGLLHNTLSQSMIYNLPRSGNVIFDTVISLVLAGLISSLFMNGNSIFKTISTYWTRLASKLCPTRFARYTRTISMKSRYDKTSQSWDSEDQLTECSTRPLINAIFYYLYKNNYRLESNTLTLGIKDSNIEASAETEFDYYNNRHIIYLPDESHTTKIHDKLSINYIIENSGGSGKEESLEREITLVLYSNYKSYLDNLIEQCYTEYLTECHKKKDTKKYFYQITKFKSYSILCRAYELNNSKTLDSVFIPESGKIDVLIDDFINSSGPFSRPFFPRKLGWMFYGLPGCGKTSMIKAIANKTGRHIINIDFTKITTNSELFRLFNMPKIESDKGEIRYKTEDVIYVIDDIDAGLDIIKTRASISSAVNAKADDDEDSDSDSASASAGNDTKIVLRKKKKTEPVDQITLQGILNVLDGTLDSPGRILIMCTNHIDKIDPALIRPGRVNQIIEFRKMTKEMTIRYLELCYELKLSNSQKDYIPDMKKTPAEIEEICIENNNNLEAVLTILKKLIT